MLTPMSCAQQPGQSFDASPGPPLISVMRLMLTSGRLPDRRHGYLQLGRLPILDLGQVSLCPNDEGSDITKSLTDDAGLGTG
jgi:hypothetical protein